jgi:uncharacterized membrane protein
MFNLLADTTSNEGVFNHMTNNGHWSGDGGFTVFWMFIIMLIIASGVVYLLVHFGNENNQSRNEDPLAIAKLRFAKGEIDKKQFDEIKKLVN